MSKSTWATHKVATMPRNTPEVMVAPTWPNSRTSSAERVRAVTRFLSDRWAFCRSVTESMMATATRVRASEPASSHRYSSPATSVSSNLMAFFTATPTAVMARVSGRCPYSHTRKAPRCRFTSAPATSSK